MTKPKTVIAMILSLMLVFVMTACGSKTEPEPESEPQTETGHETTEELSFKDFDILLAMGVLYHRKDPLSFLEKIKENLKKGGILILETLIVEGNENTVFMPEDRYLGMKNVYFIPSIPALKIWLKRLKFEVLYASSAVETTSEEQRKTEWLESYSLAELKKPEEKALRAIIIAQKN